MTDKTHVVKYYVLHSVGWPVSMEPESVAGDDEQPSDRFDRAARVISGYYTQTAIGNWRSGWNTLTPEEALLPKHTHTHTRTHARTHARTHTHAHTRTHAERERERDRQTDRQTETKTDRETETERQSWLLVF